MFEEYLREREQTPESIRSLARGLVYISRKVEKPGNTVFINLLRGSFIPTVIVQGMISKDSMIINIPASCDEVSSQLVFEILKIYLKKDFVSSADIVWIDEAYSGRMGANIGILLADILKILGAKTFSAYFLADSMGKHIKKEYSMILDSLGNDFPGFCTVDTIPVSSIHWMDNTGILGLNWGRTYSPLNKDIIGELKKHSYRFIRESHDTRDYLMQYHTAKSILPEANLYELNHYYHDPHTLWCKNTPRYADKYLHVESDPSLLIQFDLEKREEYINRLLDDIKQI